MEGNEMNVFVHTHSEDSEREENSTSESLSKHSKTGFRHFVEESTLRNISLDELEELSDAGCSSRVDGNIRRASSSVSSEPPVRFALILEWNNEFLFKPEGILRFALLVCTVISLGCISSAGDSELDILEMPFSLHVRAHIFVSVLAILIETAFLILGITSLTDSFPLYWNICDAALHASLCCLFVFTSAILLHVENHFRHSEQLPVTEWTKVQITLSAVFGFLSTLIGISLVFLRGCSNKALTVPEDIMLTSLRSS